MKSFKLNVPFTLFGIVTCIAFTACSTLSDLKPINLRAEYKENQVTDSQHPRLSWELNSEIRGQVQTAWQILAASSAELLAKAMLISGIQKRLKVMHPIRLNMRVNLYILVWVILLQTGDLTIDIYG